MRKAAFLAAACAALGGCGTMSAHRAFGPQLARARAAGVPVLIYALGVPGQIETPESRVAVPVYIQFVVTSQNPIDTIRFTFSAYSQRGTAVLGRDGGHMHMVLVGPGPFAPDRNYEVNSFHSTPAGFPGGSVACVALRRMAITFADGQRETYGPANLPIAMMPPLRKGCSDQGIVVDKMMGVPH